MRESIKLNRETRRSETITTNYQKEYEEFEVKIGDGATIIHYTDRDPVTIIEIEKDGKWIKVQQDKSIRLDNNGMSDCQDYRYERDPEGAIHTFKRTRKDKNVYTNNGVYTWGNYGSKLVFGYRKKYYDYSF